MDENKSLDRGLDALLGSAKKPKGSLEIDLKKISPNRFQPREEFDQVKIDELAESIKKHGVLNPIIVREMGLEKYEIIAGERRFRAARAAGLETVPAIMRQPQEQEVLEMALIENLQREDLNPVEEAKGYDRLKREFGLTQEEVSEATGKARSTVANSLRLLSLTETVLKLLQQGKIEKGHAKVLTGLPPSQAEGLGNRVAKEGLTVRQLEGLLKPKKTATSVKSKSRDTLNIEDEISDKFGHKITIEAKTKNTGRIVVQYFNKDELEVIIEKLLKL